MAFKFYINGQLVDQPVNDTALRTTIRRDQSVGGIVITQDADITWNGNNSTDSGVVSGYTLLKSAFDLGSCDELDVVIYDEVSDTETLLLYKGVIKVPSIQIDEQRLLASVKVQDNSYFAYINNNKSIEYNVQSDKTKSRLDITPPDIYEVDCFDSTTGVYGSSIGFLFRGYRVYDVFKYLISAISDNKLQFESVLLSTEPELFIFDGFALANPNTDPNVIVSFAKLFDEVNKIKNVAFYVDNTDANNPILKIEAKSSLFTSVQLTQFDDVKELLASISEKDIYGTIRVGASENPGGAAPLVYTFNSGTSYVGWAEETYAPSGQCNVDNELNLVNEFGITHNDVHDQLVGAADSDLDKNFLIECESIDTGALTATAVQYDSWVNTSDKYYNKGLYNPAKLLTWGSNFQSSVNNTVEIGGNGFQASLGQETLFGSYNPSSSASVSGSGNLIQPIVFADETTGSNYDGNGNYDNITGIYEAPLDGLYSFNTTIKYDATDIKICPQTGTSVGFIVINSPTLTAGTYYTELIRGFIVDLGIAIYTDNTLTTLVSLENKRFKITDSQFGESITTSNIVNLTTGQCAIAQVLVRADVFAPAYFGNNGINIEVNPLPNWSLTTFGCTVTAPFPAIYAAADSTFKCTGSPDGGGVNIENDPALYKNKVFSFEYEIPQTDFDAIKKNPIGLFAFEKDGITRYGWIDTMQRNDWTGLTNIKLITTNNALTSE